MRLITSLAVAAILVLWADGLQAGPAPDDVRGTWSAADCGEDSLRHVIDATTWAWIDGTNAYYRGEADFEVDEDRLVVKLGKAIEMPAADVDGPREGDVITYRIIPEGLKPISVVRDADTKTHPEDVPVFHRCPE